MALKENAPLWLFNGLMLWGMILGGLLYYTGSRLLDTARHHGPGVVSYGEDGEYPKAVSESRYKRHHFTIDGAMFLGVLCLWVWVAKAAKDKSGARGVGHDS